MPLTNILKKKVKYIWMMYEQEAFQALKTTVSEAPVLALLDFEQEFVLETDACDKGVGAVLMQRGHPIAFLSKSLGPKNQSLSTYDKECLAILLAIDRWRSYLQHKQFIILTDQRSLIHLTDHRISTAIQQKAHFKLMGFQFKVVYKQRTENRAADALSRRPNEETCAAMSAVTPRWMEIVVEGYMKDEHTVKLLSELSITGSNSKGYTVTDGIIRYKGRVWLGSHKEGQDAVLQALHSSGLG
jgi:hypothetical protein